MQPTGRASGFSPKAVELYGASKRKFEESRKVKYETHQCQLCNRIYPADQIVLLKLRYTETAVTVAVSEDYYMGIRSLCRFCVAGLKALPDPAVPPSSRE